MKKSDGLGRRAFLRGVGGASLSLPFLSMINGTARGQAQRPTRVVIVFHSHGTLSARWKPAAKGALTSMPALLAPLDPYRAKVNILSGIDNIVAQMNKNSNGHNGPARSILTCQPFVGVKSGQAPDNGPADGPSIDWVLGPKLQNGAPRAVLNLGVCDDDLGENTIFWKASNQAASLMTDPRTVATTIFTGVNSGATTPPATTTPVAPPAPTPQELYMRRKGGIAHAVADSYKRLSARAPAEDRVRLDAHMAQVQALEQLAAGTGTGTGTGTGSTGPGITAAASCSKPVLTLPSGYAPTQTAQEQNSAAAQIENTVMALACGITPVVTLQFVSYQNPQFPFLFNNDNQAVLRGAGNTYNDWHAMVHEAAANSDATGVNNLAKGFTFYMQQVANLVKRLGEVEDGPGQTLADNTLVLAVSEFGDGAHHIPKGLPVVMIGDLGGRLKAGQHLDMTGYTTGDLYTTIQQITTGDATKFGMTGNLSGGEDSGRAFHKGMMPGLTA
jgi:hypothetical protein